METWPVASSDAEGVWVTSSPSMAIERVGVRRGYGVIPNEWCCPVAIGYDLSRVLMTRHKTLQNGVELFHVRVEGRTQVPLGELNIVEVKIFEPPSTIVFSTCLGCGLACGLEQGYSVAQESAIQRTSGLVGTDIHGLAAAPPQVHC